ncbi:hypothetical protein EW146_g8846 [Bondarzewia mesenterica]|uniref:Uncharacterized protein n=1 Tax=Bondarzewia mesenterica TaxID=1095465 RepID=A0A4V3XD94_9AGAM|nr:hypothetical protein EW146_g8846 [Bondarzewia mesenterica]
MNAILRSPIPAPQMTTGAMERRNGNGQSIPPSSQAMRRNSSDGNSSLVHNVPKIIHQEFDNGFQALFQTLKSDTEKLTSSNPGLKKSVIERFSEGVVNRILMMSKEVEKASQKRVGDEARKMSTELEKVAQKRVEEEVRELEKATQKRLKEEVKEMEENIWESILVTTTTLENELESRAGKRYEIKPATPIVSRRRVSQDGKIANGQLIGAFRASLEREECLKQQVAQLEDKMWSMAQELNHLKGRGGSRQAIQY